MTGTAAAPEEAKVSTSTRPSDVDDLELQAQGYDRQMPRQFSFWSLLAFSYALLITWNGYGAALGTGLVEAGIAGSIWTLLIAAAIMAVFTLGMAELASAFGVAGAQYYWAYVISTPRWAPFASYLAGCFATLGYLVGQTSLVNFMSAMVLGLVALHHETYVVQRYQQWLLACLINWITIMMNIFGSKLIPAYSKFMVYFSLLTFTTTIITLLACASPNFQAARPVFVEVTNSTGWSSDGLAFIFCILNSLYGYMGIDGSAHLCEEIPGPTKNVPKIMLFSVMVGVATAFPFAIVVGFVITDIEAVLTSRTGFPLIEVYYQATGSIAGTTVLISMFIFCFLSCASGNITASSRLIMAVSRDNCIPFSNIWKQIHPRFEMPANAAVLVGFFVMAYGAIFLGSTNAFASLVGVAIIFMITTYAVPQAILVMRGRSRDVLPPRDINLGKYGIWINIGTCVLVFCIDVFYCLPTIYPVTLENMNWISVVIVGFFTLIIVNWFVWQRKVFSGPKYNLQLLAQTREGRLDPNSDEEVEKVEKKE